jgi:hypothetical protein
MIGKPKSWLTNATRSAGIRRLASPPEKSAVPKATAEARAKTTAIAASYFLRGPQANARTDPALSSVGPAALPQM